jgi:hypothetical protein
MKFGNDLSTLTASGSFECALDCNHNVAALVRLYPQHPDIWNIQGKSDLHYCLIAWLVAFHSCIMPNQTGDNHKI